MMTREEELARAIEDRDICEIDRENYNDELKSLERNGMFEDDYYYEVENQINQLDNEISYLTSVIEDLKTS